MASFLLFWVAGGISPICDGGLSKYSPSLCACGVSKHGARPRGAPTPPDGLASLLEEAEKIGRLLASWAVALPGG